MDTHDVPKVLRDLVMGHRTTGMEGVYAHITPESRTALTAADQADWHDSLAARAAISPCSRFLSWTRCSPRSGQPHPDQQRPIFMVIPTWPSKRRRSARSRRRAT
jgi:hypothetical protein